MTAIITNSNVSFLLFITCFKCKVISFLKTFIELEGILFKSKVLSFLKIFIECTRFKCKVLSFLKSFIEGTCLNFASRTLCLWYSFSCKSLLWDSFNFLRQMISEMNFLNSSVILIKIFVINLHCALYMIEKAFALPIKLHIILEAKGIKCSMLVLMTS